MVVADKKIKNGSFGGSLLNFNLPPYLCFPLNIERGSSVFLFLLSFSLFPIFRLSADVGIGVSVLGLGVWGFSLLPSTN